MQAQQEALWLGVNQVFFEKVEAEESLVNLLKGKDGFYPGKSACLKTIMMQKEFIKRR